MNPIATLRRYFANVERSRQMLEEIRAGVANLTDVTNRHLMKLTAVMEMAAQEARRGAAQQASAEAKTEQAMQRAPVRVLASQD